MADDHIDRLGRELRCSICLNTMSTPVARLPCCHYFCQPCITESVRHRPLCPICKSKVGRRDIAVDDTMDRVVQAFHHLEDNKDQFISPTNAGTSAPRAAPKSTPISVAADAPQQPPRSSTRPTSNVKRNNNNVICWLRGVDDADFQSPSKSLSATALEQLRRRPGAGGKANDDQEESEARGGMGNGDNDNSVEQMAAVVGNASLEKEDEQMRQPSADSLKEKENAAAAAAVQNKGSRRTRGSTKTAAKKDTTTAKQQKANQKKQQQQMPSSTKKPLIQDSDSDNEDGNYVENNDAVVASPPWCAGGDAHAAAAQVDDILAGLDTVIEGSDTSPHGDAVVEEKNKNKKKTGVSGDKVVVVATKKQPPQQRRQRAVSVGGGIKSTAVTTSTTDQQQQQNKKKRPASAAAIVQTDNDAKRRVPTRLLPWACGLCTFENKGGAQKCEMCGAVKGPGCTTINPPDQEPAAIEAQAVTTTVAKQPRTSAKRKAPVEAEEGKAASGGKKRASSGAKQRLSSEQQQQVAKDAPVKSPRQQTTAATTTTAATWKLPPATGTKSKSTAWVLLGSGLLSEGKELLKAVAEASGGSIVDNWSSRVTHVVCGTTPNGSVRRTFKYLMGVLSGKPVVTDAWLKACLTANKPIDTTDFIVTTDALGISGGPLLASAAIAAGAPPLLSGCEIQLQGEFSNRDQMGDLVKAAGAKLITRIPAASTTIAPGSNRPTRTSKNDDNGVLPSLVVLCEAPEDDAAALEAYKVAAVEEVWYARAVGAGVPVLSYRWLTDSISAYEVQPVEKYVV